MTVLHLTVRTDLRVRRNISMGTVKSGTLDERHAARLRVSRSPGEAGRQAWRNKASVGG